MAQVFISYRREDSQDVTGRIYDRLVEYFAAAGIFKDIDNIPLGIDFRTVLDDVIGKAGAVLVIIGPTWVSCTDRDGRRRLDSPTDIVRLEVETALLHKIPVIPVLVGDARMPNPDELPDSLKQLPYRNGMGVRADPDFNHDMERLAAALEQWITRATVAQRPTLNQALGNLAREQELARIDREWDTERQQVYFPPSARVGGCLAGIGFTVVGLVFGTIATKVAASPGFDGGGWFCMIGAVPVVIAIGVNVYIHIKVCNYEAAEAAYRKRRAIVLGDRKDTEHKGPG